MAGGTYLNFKQKYIMYLTNWVNNSIKNESWKRHDDLHIDELDELFKDQKTWIEASLFMYDVSYGIIDNSKYHLLLAIPLDYSEFKENPIDITLSYINQNLYITPPSLYIYPIGDLSYDLTLKGLPTLNEASGQLGKNVYYKEELEEEGAFSRCVFIAQEQ